MIYNNVVLTVTNADNIERVRKLLLQQGQMSLAEPGCERFEVHQSENTPGVFLLLEQWTTQAHLDAHRQAEGFTTIYQPKVLPLVERTPYLCTRLL